MTVSLPDSVNEIARRKALFAEVRNRARDMFQAGVPGIQIAAAICSGTEQVLLELVEETLTRHSMDRALVEQQGTIVAVGGMGRGELAPYSDIDLLFLHSSRNSAEFDEFVPCFVQCCWDSGIQLGHSVRDIATCVTLARKDSQIATALAEARWLWGNERLLQRLEHVFRRKVVNCRRRQFIEDCLKARTEGWSAEGPLAQELEPDIKASAGGLRDLHLLRWVASACYGIKDIDALRLHGALSKADARKLKDGWEFLTRLRIDLHLAAGRSQDRLTRDEQLRIARERNYAGSEEQRPVEQFMQDYFQHSSALAGIVQRFAALQRRKTWMERMRDLAVGHRAEGYLYVTPDQITVADRHLPKVCESLESVLRTYRSSALYDLPLDPRVREAIKEAVPKLGSKITRENARLFVDILRCVHSLGQTLRSMFNTGVLDLVIPDVSHVRNLLQFNQYHHFTVDEHTLRAVETITGFEQEDSPVGTAYRAIRHKEILHLAMILHDLGKGFKQDHCIIGEEIALRIGSRLFLPEFQTEQLALLVRKHLEMADVAWRRDITDPSQILSFSREIGSPDTLRMLYALTAADVTAVGPGTWTQWKAGLLAELFDRCQVILSGKRYSFHEAQRIQAVKQEVLALMSDPESRERLQQWIDIQLSNFSASYLTTTPPGLIAQDLRYIEHLGPTEIEVIPAWSPSTGTCEYRIITRNPLATSGCFHKMCGVLTAKRLAILTADINTTTDGVVVDRYEVIDTDYESEPPPSRFQEVAEAFRGVLNGSISVESLFIRSRRFGMERQRPVSDLPRRVQIDNQSTENRTIIDVFAHDRPGLLYTVTRTLHELKLSTEMAKISTHFDQVVDVFYVQESDGGKIKSSERLRQIKDRLEQALAHFEEHGYRRFVNGSA
jgi:[protein-PII] uridylyltransferase